MGAKPVGHTISAKSVGPICEFEYRMEEPGLHVITGDHGAGKSTLLRTVELIVGNRVDNRPTKADGSKAGEASVGGKSIRITRSIREEGELSLEGLSDLDLAGLHSPKFLNAPTRDNHRIKALARLAGVTADPALFHPLFGTREEFDSIVDSEAIKTDDLVEMAAKVKRAIEKSAQAQEKQGDTARTKALTQAEIFANVDLDATHDAKALQAVHVAAIEEKSRLAQQRTDALAAKRAAGEAREKLGAAGVGVSVTDAAQSLAIATEAREWANVEVIRLERELSEARAKLTLTKSEETAADEAWKAATKQDATLAEWRAQIEAAESVACPSEDAVTAAGDAVDTANAAVELGIKVRNAITAKAEADRLAEVAKGHEQAAKRLRDAAAATHDILSDAISRIPNCQLKVWNDPDGNTRLVLETDRSEKEPFDDLSDGERYDVLIPMLARNGRIIVLSQAAYGELSPTIRRRVHELARQRGCFILTAQADSGPLQGQMFQPELAEAVA